MTLIEMGGLENIEKAHEDLKVSKELEKNNK